MKKRLKEILTEWQLDCQESKRLFHIILPQHKLVDDCLKSANKQSFKALHDWLENELTQSLGYLPKKGTKITMIGIADDSQLLDEQVEVYWELKNEI